MSDQFIERMKARSHARRDVLGMSLESDKENTANNPESSWLNSTRANLATPRSHQKRTKSTDLDRITNIQQCSRKNELNEEPRESSAASLSSHSLPTNSPTPNKASNSILQASSNINSSRGRFQHLSNRSKQLQEWEDDYTYHSVCGGSIKEVENSGLGLHGSSSLPPVFEFEQHVIANNKDHRSLLPVIEFEQHADANNKDKQSMECETPPISKYYFGGIDTTDNCKISKGFNPSNKFTNPPVSQLSQNYAYQSPADSSFHSANSTLSPHTPHYNTPCTKNNNSSPSFNTKYTPLKTKAVSSSVSVTPTRRLAWDKQLLRSLMERSYNLQIELEAQGFTPSPSKSKLGYDFRDRDRSPIKESSSSISMTISRESSSSKPLETESSKLPKVVPEPPRIVSMQSKPSVQNSVSLIKERSQSPINTMENEKGLPSPTTVSGLRNQWEEHIRSSSPDRQQQRIRSPSPERKFNHGLFSRDRSPVKPSFIHSNNSEEEQNNYPTIPKKQENADVPPHQGFNRGSASRISTRSISPHKPSPCGEVIKGDVVMPETIPVVNNPMASVRERAAAFASLSGKKVPEKDPAELSLKDRLNMFEKKKGAALIPKAPFGQCISDKTANSSNSSKSSNSSQPSEQKKETRSEEEKSYQSQRRLQTNTRPETKEETSTHSSHVGAQRKHFENFEDNWRDTSINSKILNERQNDLQILHNRFRRAPNNLSPEKSEAFPKPESSDSEYPESDESTIEQEVFSSNASRGSFGPPKPPRSFIESPPKEFVRPLPPTTSKSPSKRLNSTELDESYPRSPRKEYVPKIKPGCLFPSLSDIENQSEAVESDEDTKNSSFAESVLTCASAESLGTKIQKMAQKSPSVQAPRQLSAIEEHCSLKTGDRSMSSSTLEALEAIDEAIDEAFDDDYQEVAPLKRGRNGEEDQVSDSIYKTPRIYHGATNSKVSSDNALTHTISMYRKQKPAEVTVTPVRQIVRKHDLSSPSKDSPISPSVTISSRIRVLQEEEEHQLTVISQASSAISVVTQHPEQHGTIQHVEAEKLLLVATQKRQSAVHEIQRMKAEGALGKRNYWSQDDDSCRGSISISNITLPLKSDYHSKLNEKSFYHFVVLVKHRDQVITSELQATPNCIADGAITFPNLMSLYNLTADFNISLEVYAFKVEPLASTGIKKEHSRMKLTPLKRLQKETKSCSPAVSSPGGPYSIRSSSFSLIGFANLNINTLTRNAWTLEKVPFSSPVNGHLLMRVSVAMEGGVKESSFLTMFEDVGGFGAWNRRWSVLGGPMIQYWSYPEDEFNKECIGALDLRMCTTRKVELVSREICARQHTFQLTLMRPLRRGDKADLVHEIKDNVLISRILLSADSREERILWCNKLNKALASIRAWDPDSLKPEDYQV